MKTTIFYMLLCLCFVCSFDCRAQAAGDSASKAEKAGAVMGGVDLVGTFTETKDSVNQQKIDGNLKLANKFSQKAEEAKKRGDTAAAQDYENKSNQWKDKAKELGWKAPADGGKADTGKPEGGWNPFGVLNTIAGIGSSGHEPEKTEPEKSEPATTDQGKTDVKEGDFSGFGDSMDEVKSDIGREASPVEPEQSQPEPEPGTNAKCADGR